MVHKMVQPISYVLTALLEIYMHASVSKINLTSLLENIDVYASVCKINLTVFIVNIDVW